MSSRTHSQQSAPPSGCVAATASAIAYEEELGGTQDFEEYREIYYQPGLPIHGSGSASPLSTKAGRSDSLR